MKHKKPKEPEQEAAFVMAGGDRFHSIIVSDPIRFEVQPDTETIITYFVIRRAIGTFDIVNVLKTFQGDKCVSRNVQTKAGISAKAVGSEIDDIRINFALSIQKETGLALTWNTLDLSGVEGMKEQVLRIKAWNRVGVKSPLFGSSADLPPGISLN